MLQRKHFKQIILSATAVSAIYLFCVAPVDPYSDSKTSSQLLLKNSLGEVDSQSVEDSVGKPISIGICRYLPKNIDSVKLTVNSKLTITSTTLYTVLDTVIRFFTTSKTYDTLWKQITFNSAGEFQVIANAFTSAAQAGKTLVDSASIIIYNRSIPNNLPPKWETDTIKMNVFSGAAISINLADTCDDPNNDPLIFSLLSGLPARDTIIGSLYRFTPLVADTGSFAIHIVAADPNQATDTMIIALNVRIAPIDSIKPTYKLVKPNKDSISVNATSFKIDIIFTDASTIASVKCSTALALFVVDHIDSTYSAIVTGLQANVYNAITFVAIDASSRANETRKTLYIKNDPVLQDLAGPILRRNQPSHDSITTTVDSVAISIIATDQSGVASVACLLGTTALMVKKADSVYSTVIKGLSTASINRVSFIATDSSTNKNTDTLTFFIKFEPTGNDHQKPTMRRKTPAGDSAVVSSASATISVIATDLSGIASIVCSLGDSNFVVTAADSIYSATVKGLIANKFNKVRFIATDASSSGNKETLFVTLKYDPTIADNSPPIFTKVNGPTGQTVTTPTVSYEYAITDTNGIDSVYWTLNGMRQGNLSIDASEHYKLNATLSVQSNRIVIYAWDKSSNHNRDSAVITLNYTSSCIVRFNSLGGSAIDSQKVNYGDKVTEPPVKSKKDGYSFGGWYKDEAYTTKWNFESDIVTSNVILYAKWTINQYTISFNSQGGSQVSSEQRNYGDTVNTPNTPTYEGFDFVGWYKEASCVTKWVFGSFKVTQDTTLYAKWIVVYTVIYDKNGGSGSVPVDSKKYKSGEQAVVQGNIGNLYKAGYEFSGWNTNNSGTGTQRDSGTSFQISESVVLYAKWKAICSVTFDGQGATTAPSPTSKSITEGATVGALPADPKKTGYFFNGWWTGKKGTSSQVTASTVVSATFTAYANWIIKDYDNNIYTDVTIGTQVWMVENLKVTRYNDGTAIDGYLFPDSLASNKEKYGILYHGSAIDATHQNIIAPSGWHVPDDNEWTILQNYLIANGYNYDGITTGNKIGKAMASTTDWENNSTLGNVGYSPSTNNRSGFNAEPAGAFTSTPTGSSYGGFGQSTVWWSTTIPEGAESYVKNYFGISYDLASFNSYGAFPYQWSSIRLIRDY